MKPPRLAGGPIRRRPFSAAFSGGPIEASTPPSASTAASAFSAAFSGGPIEALPALVRAGIVVRFSAAFSGGPIEARAAY